MNYQDLVKLTPEFSNQSYEAKERNAKMLVEKWNRTGLLKKITKNDSRQTMAIMLENQAKALRTLNESSSVSDIASFNKIAFPLVRRVFGSLLANEIVSVQPMNMPAGLLFYLDFVYDRTKPGFAFESGKSLYGNRNTVTSAKLQGIGGINATGGYYNLNSGYSKRMFKISSDSQPGAVSSTLTATSATVTGTLTGFDFTLVASDGSIDVSQLRTIRPVKAGEISVEGGTFRSLVAVKSLTSDSLSALIDPGLTQLVSTSVIRIFANTDLGGQSALHPLTGSSSAVLVGPAATKVDDLTPSTLVGDFESVSEIPQINIQIKSVPVVAITRKLKTVWTPELSQDMNSTLTLDPDVELTRVLSESIGLEIDNEILSDLLAGAEVRAVWSRKNGRFLKLNADGTVSLVTFANASNSTYQSNFGNQNEWYQTLVETINTVSNEIYKRNKRSGASWLVVSPEIASIIESLGSFQVEVVDDPAKSMYSVGVVKIGTLQSRYVIYKNPHMPADKILLGYRGDSFLETGYVYAPYVPLLITPTVFEPENFTPRKAVMTRYATQMIKPEYYGTITVFDLDVIGSPASV